MELAPEVEPEVIPEPASPPPSPSAASRAPTIYTRRPPPAPKRNPLGLIAGAVLLLGAGVVGGLAIPNQMLDGIVPEGWLPEATADTASVPPAASASASTAPSAKPEADAEPELSREELAAAGNQDAIKELEAIADTKRTPVQNAALARGEVAHRLAELEKLGKLLAKNPDLADDEGTMVTLLEYARDPHTTFAAQELIASLKNSAAVDLLFEIWTGVRDRTPATVLAERLVTSEAVRQHASPALAVTLELREVESCEEVMPLIERVGEVGDARAIRSLAKLTTRRDCGDSGAEECFACLKERENRKTLAAAALAAQKREPPKF